MAISPFPTLSDAGVLCRITAVSIFFVTELVVSILRVVGIRITPLNAFSSDSSECRRRPSESYMEEFRSRMPAMQYDSVFAWGCGLNRECCICISEFERTAEINRLSCGHVFHRACFEKWLSHWNTTCPLCRNCVMLQEGEDDDCPM